MNVRSSKKDVHHEPSSSAGGCVSSTRTTDSSAFRMEKICKETTITRVSQTFKACYRSQTICTWPGQKRRGLNGGKTERRELENRKKQRVENSGYNHVLPEKTKQTRNKLRISLHIVHANRDKLKCRFHLLLYCRFEQNIYKELNNRTLSTPGQMRSYPKIQKSVFYSICY